MLRHARQLTRWVVPLAAVITLLQATSAAAAAPHRITQTSIDGIKLGMTKAQVNAILGKTSTQAGTFDNSGQPEGWTTLVSATAKVSVYFEKGSNKAIMVTTWNPAIRTAQGAGPCTKISKLKTLYGSALKKSKHNLIDGKAYAYTLGNGLMFGADGAPPQPSPTVTAVGLYKGVAMQGYAGFVTDSEQNCS